MTKGTGEPLFGKKARGSLEAKRRPVKLGSQANLGQSHSPADASQCETPVQTAHWKPRTEWSLPPTSPEVKAPLPPAMPGRCWQTAPALSPPSLPASACLAAHAPAWAPAPHPHPRRGLPGKTFSGIQTMTHFHTHIGRTLETKDLFGSCSF